MQTTIFTWLLLFLSHYATPAPRCVVHTACTDAERAARADVFDTRAAAVGDALRVAMDPDESPLFTGPDARERTALELLAVAAHETGLRPRLWRGECYARECDGGRATGELQLHLGRFGVTLVGDRWVKPCTDRDTDCITPTLALYDHAYAFRVALHMLRGGGLTGYTGQPADGPAVRWIEGAVAQWTASHPAPIAEAGE